MSVLVRRLVATVVLFALAPVVFSAPFLHFHVREGSGHAAKVHHGQMLVLHTHISGCACGRHSGTTAVASQDDDDAVFLDWFQDNPHPAPTLEFVLVEVVAGQPAPELAASWTDVPTCSSHDPPLTCSLSPRSPPILSDFSQGA
jgi:hypothetical protein